jgi:CheY-like chemotaxis protein
LNQDIDTDDTGERLLRILLVDDDPDVALTFRTCLVQNGIAVDTYNDPTEALSRDMPGVSDLLLLDVRMPKNERL